MRVTLFVYNSLDKMVFSFISYKNNGIFETQFFSMNVDSMFPKVKKLG